ncbi:MAG: tandem-95 repeat protein, partial [Candidatus Methanofastidiosum sp.]|nr:tandem-95 repeat protein [Methanofastidiosum sp.]
GVTDLNTSSGNFTYNPTSNYFGGDSFTFKVNDGAVDSNVSTVSITVNAENDAPTASNDAYSTYDNTPLVVVAPGILGNDFDVEGDILSAILVDDVDYGTLILNANGSFTYTPNSDFQGPDSFAYKVNDGLLDSNIATVTITVENLPPIIKRGVTLPENILFSNIELVRLVIHTESISIDDIIGEASDIAETIVVDGIEVYVIELSEGKNTIRAQVYNPGFLTQIDVNIRFENLPQGVSIEIDGQSQKIRAHNTGDFILTINVSPGVPKGEYFITAISSTRKGGKDKAIIKIIIK